MDIASDERCSPGMGGDAEQLMKEVTALESGEVMRCRGLGGDGKKAWSYGKGCVMAQALLSGCLTEPPGCFRC